MIFLRCLLSLQLDIPNEISESWYSGQVIVSLKESAFEPSFPLRHMAELCKNLFFHSLTNPCCVYTQMEALTTGLHMFQ